MKTEGLRRWDDLQTGETYDAKGITITRRDILDFAADFDPQPYHLDPEAANDSIFGGLCASGWHVTALMMRLLTDTFTEQNIDLLGSNRVGQLRWRKPVFADDTLASKITITEKTPAEEDKRFGFIDCDIDVSNQHGDSVINLTTSLMIGTGEAGA
ncbi:MAG: MaoC/PaaZ C-terminal domain-containing protein [Pseudomonadota bacterium]